MYHKSAIVNSNAHLVPDEFRTTIEDLKRAIKPDHEEPPLKMFDERPYPRPRAGRAVMDRRWS